MDEKLNREPNFDHVARVYRWLEYLSFGRLLERCRFHFISHLLNQRRILVIGDGDGRFIAKLLSANTQMHVDAVDTSGAMLELLRRRLKGFPRLATHHMSAVEFVPKRQFDLVATHFFFDCLTNHDAEKVVTTIASSVEERGYWLVSEFQIPSGRVGFVARILIKLLYLAFRILTGLGVRRIPDYQTPLKAANFKLELEHKFLFGIVTAQLWQKGKVPILPFATEKTPN